MHKHRLRRACNSGSSISHIAVTNICDNDPLFRNFQKDFIEYTLFEGLAMTKRLNIYLILVFDVRDVQSYLVPSTALEAQVPIMKMINEATNIQSIVIGPMIPLMMLPIVPKKSRTDSQTMIRHNHAQTRK